MAIGATQTGISIVVPFYNAERYIGDCIESLLAQEAAPAPFDVLLVDNNSTDRSAAIVESFAGDDERVTLLKESKQGAYAARNRALSVCQAPLVVFTDPDCIAEGDWLAQITAPFEHAEIGIVMGGVMSARNKFPLGIFGEYETNKEAFVLGGTDASLYFGRTNNMAVRKCLLDELGPFAERLRGSDTLLVRAAVRHYSPEAVHYRPEARVRHMEIHSIWDYLGKVVTYARSSREKDASIAVPLLTRKMRWRLVEETCEGGPFSLPRKCLLLSLLGMEGIAWRLGRWRA